MSQGFFSFGETKQTMIQNELLPGCAVMAVPCDELKKWCAVSTEVIYDAKNYSDVSEYKPIPLTADTVSRVEGAELMAISKDGGKHQVFVFKVGMFNVNVHCWINDDCQVFIDGKEIHHFKGVHLLQITLQLLTGTMPKYDVR